MAGRFGGVIFDMDGVLFRGERAIPGASGAVERARGAGLKVAFLTNNSTRHRSVYVDKLSRMGIPADLGEVISSAYATALYLRDELDGRPGTAYVVGGSGLERELREAGVELADGAEPVDFVVVGMDRSFTYEKLRRAQRAILHGARFIATNADPVYPTEDGFLPGGGAVVAAIETCVRRAPDLVVGKPRAEGIQTILREWNVAPERCAFVGDQLATDVVAGNRAGVYTILVLTGISSREKAEAAEGECRPCAVLDDVVAAVNHLLDGTA
ncbi:MAG: HAD-IIA family hydrolase [Armatimonadota bacterium]